MWGSLRGLIIGSAAAMIAACGSGDGGFEPPAWSPLTGGASGTDAGRGPGAADAAESRGGTGGARLGGSGGARNGVADGGGAGGVVSPTDAGQGGNGLDADTGAASDAGTGDAADAGGPTGSLLDAALSRDGACTGTADAAVAVQCSSDLQCCESGRVCGELLTGSPTRAFCSAKFPAGAALGAQCQGALSGNGACRSGVCLFTSCASLCRVDADCGDAAFLCSPVTVSGTPMGFCARACTGDRSCAAGQFCVLRDNAPAQRLDRLCRPAPTGASPPGTATTTANTCDHGLAVTTSAGEYCTAACDVNADCPVATPKCASFDFSKPGGGTVAIGLCTKP